MGRRINRRKIPGYRFEIEGSHRQLKHKVKLGRVTVAGQPGDDLAPGTLNSVLKQADLKKMDTEER